MRHACGSGIVVLALLLSAHAAFADGELTVTFTVGAQSLTLVDDDDNGRIGFAFALNGLDALGRVTQSEDGSRENITIGRSNIPIGSHLTNTTVEPIDVTVLVTSRVAPSAITSSLDLAYDGRARDGADTNDPVQVPQHGVKVWLDEQSGSPALAVEGPAIDAPSGVIDWNESEDLVEATAASFVIEWTMTLGPSDEIALGETVRLVRGCPGFRSSPWQRAGNPVALSERKGEAGAGLATPCPLTSTDGSCANYRWYNLCSGYLWIYGDWACGEAVGVQFGGPEQPCVAPGNVVKRAITYYRNVRAGYGTVDVHIDADDNGDGCPDATLASDLDLDPGLRWNCSEFNVCIPSGFVIIRTHLDGGGEPTLATDGPFSEACDPIGVPRSFYYGINGSACIPWQGPTSRYDNFLCWLIVDSGDCSTSTESTSWGRLKGLYR